MFTLYIKNMLLKLYESLKFLVLTENLRFFDTKTTIQNFQSFKFSSKIVKI